MRLRRMLLLLAVMGSGCSRPPTRVNVRPITTLWIYGRLLWDDSTPVWSGAPPCAGVDIVAFDYSQSSLHPTEIHASSGGDGSYAISWPSRCSGLEAGPQYAVHCSTGLEAVQDSCGPPIACQSGPQRHDCWFRKASCSP